ncbi:helix-turn-helix domain-containing protein [Streptomyces sp. NBC_01762]|uniref:helix-turn-helix domain-containing protein n=1 Tax=unclassified Streptomyces TaxID=2593676 RepID=UPI002DDB98D5|nr:MULTISPECIES: helix-turn-helix domain-containing protein [unclassified Streptomyces]WSC48742.1 helix-turn-helix domain-containing protein [Streptomyces sp. NBC_01762]WSD28394.1 helix-turn-helix domain-containing protein [Streptomyces sp. NBC_01751]
MLIRKSCSARSWRSTTAGRSGCCGQRAGERPRTDRPGDGGELVRSLAAPVDASGDGARAARWLVLPSHTLRYRLRRARERFGIDLDDPDTRLLITSAVRLSG